VADVQVLRGGGETHLHAHPHLDGFWFILKGRARFHGENDLIGDVGPNEGVLLPRGTKYWFEAVGPEPLQVLQIEVPDAPKTMDEVRADRVDYGEAKSGATTEHLEARPVQSR
jgi:mannose-6-phosphate isomerase-like protein (cupin superfamily)